MTSTRLPGKVLMDLVGQPMLSRQLTRMERSRSLDEIMIATTVNATDDPVVELALNEGLDVFRGSEDDVLSRFVGAARQVSADVVVRITADCPLIDPEVINRVVDELTALGDACDYCSNVLERSYPRGLDVEAFWRRTLEECDRLGTSQSAREHVTAVIRQERPESFKVRSIRDDIDNSDLRWTVDTPADLELIRAIYDGMGLVENHRGYRDIAAYVRAHPELLELNAGIETWDPSGHGHGHGHKP